MMISLSCFSNSQAQELIVVEEAGQATELRKLKEALEAKVQAARAESEAAKAELLQVTGLAGPLCSRCICVTNVSLRRVFLW